MAVLLFADTLYRFSETYLSNDPLDHRTTSQRCTVHFLKVVIGIIDVFRHHFLTNVITNTNKSNNTCFASNIDISQGEMAWFNVHQCNTFSLAVLKRIDMAHHNVSYSRHPFLYLEMQQLKKGKSYFMNTKTIDRSNTALKNQYISNFTQNSIIYACQLCCELAGLFK